MLPEMAAAYVVSLVPNAALTGLHLFLYQRKSRSPKVRQLQSNLGKIGLHWTETEGAIVSFTEESFAKDARKYRRSVFLLGGFCLVLSWLGVITQLIVMASLRYLAVSRLEQRVFTMDLSKNDLLLEATRARVEELRSLYPTLVAQPVSAT